MRGKTGIGIISDYKDQPLLIRSHLGDHTLDTVGAVKKNPGERYKSVINSS